MSNGSTVIPLFDQTPIPVSRVIEKTKEELKRLDLEGELKKKILPLCRLKHGEIWEDSVSGHKVGVLDATDKAHVSKIMGSDKAQLAVNDPPYNVVVGNSNTRNLSKTGLDEYLEFSSKWIKNTISSLDNNAHFYLWMGADYKDNFQPFPDVIVLLREFGELKPRNLITMRNQRGFGTQKNWMWIRQELLYYVKGNPDFFVEAEYTDIPKILRGYYKKDLKIVSGDKNKIKILNLILNRLQKKDFAGGVNTKRFKVFEYNHTLEGTKKGPSS